MGRDANASSSRGTSLSLAILITYGCGSLMADTTTQSWTPDSLIIVLTAVYQTTLDADGYILAEEIPSTTLRVETVIAGRVADNITRIITHSLAARMITPSTWKWKGKSSFFFVGTAVLCLLWCYFSLLQMYGLSYLETTWQRFWLLVRTMCCKCRGVEYITPTDRVPDLDTRLVKPED
ncbi:hypothetical protein BDV39DRAFT_201053 [Aspergillus sergii]|uniref:Major facilitator superfamily (MFS) profile domain-containing protein n=1 Tax=Aspergillus sergii TaxID=1034303 RepID=A0A5N6XF89_9EURO|nr:hypothetical protein BDV39DRAFT_201053 [Aspergillus sergii]